MTATDFPSALKLKERGLSRVVVIQSYRKIQDDLLAVLLGWQSEGIGIWRQRPWEPWDPAPMALKKPNRIVRVWNWIKLAIGSQRTQFDTFGQYVPPSSG